MARIAITGAGMNGMTAALLLAADGHEVTVVERDPSPPSPPQAAWETWERPSVGQFRLLHYLQPRWHSLAAQELPQVVTALEAAGALRWDVIDRMGEAQAGPRRPDDDDLVTVTGRRPVIEAALAAVAESEPGVTVRRGSAVRGLATGEPVDHDVPHVTGLETDDGERIGADLVVDCTGRRSPLPRWLAAIGCRPHVEVEEDLGFVYYGRHFRGELPELKGSILEPRTSYSILVLPADNDTWGVGVIAGARDSQLRILRHDDVWTKLVEADPVVGHWADGEPLDGVRVMAKLPDRYRRFVVDDAPVVTGLLALGDSWACTNPSLGRGITMGLMHALALRDLLRTGVGEHPYKLALAWDDATEATVTPWYEATVAFDRHRLAEIDAEIAGEAYEPDDPQFELSKALRHAAMDDHDLLRAFQRIVGMQATPTEVLAEPGMFDRVIELGAGWRDAPPVGPSREEVLELLGRWSGSASVA
jgi:2-polyprenyl-6-methoxyphenol hydroxylase-like FAD-dependent oxidoreductase